MTVVDVDVQVRVSGHRPKPGGVILNWVSRNYPELVADIHLFKIHLPGRDNAQNTLGVLLADTKIGIDLWGKLSLAPKSFRISYGCDLQERRCSRVSSNRATLPSLLPKFCIRSSCGN